jgi:hypothetical protein
MATPAPDAGKPLVQVSSAMTPNRQYNSSFASKGALLSDVKTVLQEVDAGQDVDRMRRAVIEDDLLDRGTLQNRQTVWREIARRYISGQEPGHVMALARMVTDCPNSTAVDLALFYEYCQADALMYDLTAYCTYELYQSARTALDKADINDWLARQEAIHPEIAEWSPTTRNRLIKSYLATIRDFGLVTGTKQKEFHKVYVPREAFVYALYHQKERGIQGKALIGSTDWRLFLLSESEVIFLLEDAALGGFIHFRRAGDIYDLRFVYNDLSEVVHAITG